MLHKAYYKSPIGIIEIVAYNDAIIRLDFVEKEAENKEDMPQVLKRCLVELDEYFKGERKDFTVKVDLCGTDFQNKAWQELCNIPYGETISYKEQAIRVGNPKAIRAVGLANSKNPVGIIVPCHRVIGSNGKLTGYAGGLWRKEWLLEHEKRVLNK